MAMEYETVFRLGAELESRFGATFRQANAKVMDLDRKLRALDGQGGKGKVFGKGIADGIIKIGKVAGATAITAAGAAAAGGIFATGMVIKKSLEKAMDFESEMSTIQALTGATAKEMNEMSALALKMGADTKYSALEAGQGIEELLKAGLTPAAVQAGGLESALNLATAGGLDLASAAEIMSTALNAFKDDGMSAAHAADVLAGTANASATDVEDLRYSLAMVSAVASGVGMSFDDTNVALGLFANNGLKGSDAGTSLKTMLMRLQPTTDAAYNAFDKLGLMTTNVQESLKFLSKVGVKPASDSMVDVTKALKGYAAQEAKVKPGTARAEKAFKNLASANNLVQSAFYDSKGNLKDLGKVADLLKTKMAKLTNAQRAQYMQTMFGTDAIRASNILFKEGGEGVKEFYKEMEKVTALDVAKKKMDNAAGAVEQFRGALETLQISGLMPILPYIKRLANAAADFVTKYTPQITAGIQRMVDSSKKYLLDHFINNPEFTKLKTFESKVDFVFTDVAKTFNEWWDASGSAAFKGISEEIMRVMSNTLAASTGPIADAGLKIGVAMADGMWQGLKNSKIGKFIEFMTPDWWEGILSGDYKGALFDAVSMNTLGKGRDKEEDFPSYTPPDTKYDPNPLNRGAKPQQLKPLPGLLQYARGGFASQASIFGEKGLEAAIPINNDPRSHALLERTNRLMGHTNSSGGNFVFSPVYNFNGPADRAAVEQMEQRTREDFTREYDAYQAQQRRRAMI